MITTVKLELSGFEFDIICTALKTAPWPSQLLRNQAESTLASVGEQFMEQFPRSRSSR